MRGPVRNQLHSCLIVLVFTFCAITLTQGQTFTVIHTFTGASDGSLPFAGVTLDRVGNLYGTTADGGTFGNPMCVIGCGTVFKMTHSGAAWILTSVYSFQGPWHDGSDPEARVLFGPDGALYGTTGRGGDADLGTLFRLAPQPVPCKTTRCFWNETASYSFPNNLLRGEFPQQADLTFDAAGNVFGTTPAGGLSGNCYPGPCGTVFEWSRSGGQWSESVLYNFASGTNSFPYSGVTLDNAGNMYGTASLGGSANNGVIYELIPNGASWSQTVLYEFEGPMDGASPKSGLQADSQGNFFGATSLQGSGGGGTIFELSPTNGGWTYQVIYSLHGRAGPQANLSIDGSGSLYGTTYADGAYGYGNVFKLSHVNGSWVYTSLHDFTGGSDGGNPTSNVSLDAAGDLYGTTWNGGTVTVACPIGCGTVWEITP